MPLNTFMSLVLYLASFSAADIYDGGCHSSQRKESQVLRIGNGGAGQSGLIKELADNFIQNRTNECTKNPFKIKWVKGDTTETINNLKSGDVDIGITYSTAAERLAIQSGIAHGCDQCLACEKCQNGDHKSDKEFCGTEGNCDCCEKCQDYPCYIFRDHFYLVGPTHNLPGELKLKREDGILSMFSKIYNAAESSNSNVRFLSRFDKSATNIKDSELWIKVGQVPWAVAYSKWYHQFLAYPLQALEAAIRLREFTITDRGTHLTLTNQNKALKDETTIYKSGENEPQLLNPGHLLVGSKARDEGLARDFVNWVTSTEGQTVITNFHKGDKACLYKPYPSVNEVQPSKSQAYV
ncbi:hypothetical protein CBS147332_8394 [Penicillium roqueforti]|nr:hypothetical protein CBS147332_8394 [Penicillium roqueforti]KAI3100066.1 hypothetical protein CBS147331_8437 [Penicillium roqueforti]